MSKEINSIVAENALALLKKIGYDVTKLESEDFKAADESKSIEEGVKEVAKKELESHSEQTKRDIQSKAQSETYIVAAKRVAKALGLDFANFKDLSSEQLEAICNSYKEQAAAEASSNISKDAAELKKQLAQAININKELTEQFEKYKSEYNDEKIKNVELEASTKVAKEYAFNQIIENEVSEICKKAKPNSPYSDKEFVKFKLMNDVYKKGIDSVSLEFEEGTTKLKDWHLLNDNGDKITVSSINPAAKKGFDIFSEKYGTDAFKTTVVEKGEVLKTDTKAEEKPAYINPLITDTLL
jgi:hypothetical protein